MGNHSVNLIIPKKDDSAGIKKAKVIMPVVSVVALILFIIFYFATLLFNNSNRSEFLSVKNEADILEKKIGVQKNTEGLYTVSLAKVTALDGILENSRKFSHILSEINNLNRDQLSIRSAVVDNLGNVSFAVIASDSGILDDFVSLLQTKEDQKLFSQMLAKGIIREKNGDYSLNILLKSNPSLLQ